jgi:hypothetical protein
MEGFSCLSHVAALLSELAQSPQPHLSVMRLCILPEHLFLGIFGTMNAVLKSIDFAEFKKTVEA